MSITFDPCPTHQPMNRGYAGNAEEDQRRMAKGFRQRLCPKCGRYYWRDEFGAGWHKAVRL